MPIHSYLELPWAIPEAEAAPFEEAQTMVVNGNTKKKVVPRRSEIKCTALGSFEIHFEKFGDPFISRSILGGGTTV